MIGTLINAAAIILGTLIGLLLRKGIPQRLQDTVGQGQGLCVIWREDCAFIDEQGALRLIVLPFTAPSEGSEDALRKALGLAGEEEEDLFDLIFAQISMDGGKQEEKKAEETKKPEPAVKPEEPKEVKPEVKAAEERLGNTGRVLLRKSGTEPVLRVMAEATTAEACEKEVDAIIHAMDEAGQLIRIK